MELAVSDSANDTLNRPLCHLFCSQAPDEFHDRKKCFAHAVDRSLDIEIVSENSAHFKFVAKIAIEIQV